MSEERYVIGVDYGTDSVRSVIVNTKTGEEVASAVFEYPRWKKGHYCDATLNQFRQHPLDYVEGLESTVTQCVKRTGPGVGKKIVGLSVDTTGSTPIAVNKEGTPLSLLPEFENNPNAMFVLWKDHTAVREAAEINKHAEKFSENYLRFVGGIYSSEWFWAKLLHILRVDDSVSKSCYSWVEHCDWIPYLLTGKSDLHLMKRGVCSAGHKALWAIEFGGLPPEEFFASLDPRLKGFRSRLFDKTYASDQSAGTISKEWASKLSLPPDTIIGVGAFDAHMGAVGGQIEPYHLSKVMGTSTCDMLVAPIDAMKGKLVKGICGQVPGSVIPGMIGMEAGQSAFGDSYAWFSNLISWPLKHILSASGSNENSDLISEAGSKIITELSRQAASIDPGEISELGIDWLNGRRTPDANQELKAAISGISLGSDAPRIFRAIVESTCFGAKAIVDRFRNEGVPVKGLIGLGGVAKKSPFIMQMMADVMDMPIRIHSSDQTCALGAAMFAATASGVYKKVEDAMEAMGPGFDKTYSPDKKNVGIYSRKYERYKALAAFIENQNHSFN
ncbi:MAG: ribulokinase [Bacteroidetes bacterium]|nr:MAG: ribulokinase [Bacteroidota bacterium]